MPGRGGSARRTRRTKRTPSARTPARPRTRKSLKKSPPGRGCPRWEDDFLEQFRKLRSVSHACRKIRKGRTTVYDHKAVCKRFRDRWIEVDREHDDAVERSSFAIAIEGDLVPLKIGDGNVIWYRRRDPSMLRFLLSTRLRDKYGREAGVQDPGTAAAQIRQFVAEAVGLIPTEKGKVPKTKLPMGPEQLPKVS